MRIFKTLTVAAVIIATAIPAYAQSEGGLNMTAEVEKKIDKKLSVSLEAGMRTRNNFKTMDRWSLGLGAEYKLTKWLKADAGYILLNDNNHEKINYKSSGAYNNWRPSYWGLRHRVYASLTGSYKFNNIKLALRERWQYTYRPAKNVQRWDFDNETWEDKVRSGKAKNVLRSKFEISYDKKHALLTPYANIELYNSWGIDKIRYTVGTDFNFTKQHTLTMYYRFQDVKNVSDDDYDPDMHYLGIGYKFKF